MERRENTFNKKKPEFEKAGLKLNIEKKKKTKIMASGPITSWQINGEKVEAVTAFLFWALKSLRMELAAIKLEDDCLLAGKLTNLDKQTNLFFVKKQRHHFANKGPYSQGYGLSGSPVSMCELDHEEGRAQKN